MTTKHRFLVCAAALLVAAGTTFTAGADEPVASSTKDLGAETTKTPSKWFCDINLYGLAAGMSGDVGVGPFNANLDVPFHEVLDHLKAGGMGTVRVGYDRWSISTDVIYMGLEGEKRGVSANMDEWLVQPVLEYRVCEYFTPYAGARYMNISAEISGTGPFGNFRAASGTQQWWDPVVGCQLNFPIYKTLSFAVRGDVGGFSVGSNFSWQAEPVIIWQVSKLFSVYAGYRWISADYETGSGARRFKYDVLSQGFELGFGLHF